MTECERCREVLAALARAADVWIAKAAWLTQHCGAGAAAGRASAYRECAEAMQALCAPKGEPR